MKPQSIARLFVTIEELKLKVIILLDVLADNGLERLHIILKAA